MFYHSRVRAPAEKEPMPEVFLHGDAKKADASFSTAYHEALLSGRWMAAVWKVQDGRLYMERVTTNDFPTGDFDAALDLLRVEFERLKHTPFDPPVPPPLSPAFGGAAIDPAGEVE